MRWLNLLIEPRNLAFAFLLMAVVASGMSVVYAKFESRKLFNEIEKLRLQRDDLAVEWGRLQIELATWAEHSGVQEKAMRDLDMQMPVMQNIVVVRP